MIDRTGQLWWRGPLPPAPNDHQVQQFLVVGPPEKSRSRNSMTHPILVIRGGRSFHKFESFAWNEHHGMSWDDAGEYVLLSDP